MVSDGLGDNKQWFQPKVTLGNIIEITVIVLSVIAAFYNLKISQDRMQSQFEIHLRQSQETKQQLSQYLRVDVAKEQRDAVLARLDNITERLQEVERNTRKR